MSEYGLNRCWLVLAASHLVVRLFAADVPGPVAAATDRHAATSSLTPAAWMAAQPKPQFRDGHTLPPLTRFGWTLPFEARVELAEHWGYALEFGGYATEQQVAKDLADTNSIVAKLCALTAANPKKYPLAVIVARDLPKQVPPETWARDGEGRALDAKAQSMDGNVWDDHKTVWSPEAPDAVFEQAGALRANPLRRIRERCPIAIVLNGGEYALGVLGFTRPVWEKDPRILKAKGERTWFDYISERKAHQEMIISEAVRKAVPDRVLYSYYTSGGGTHRNRIRDWQDWCWAYEAMKPVSDLPSNEGYYQSFNSGWTGPDDLLTLTLNATAREIAHGQPLSYNWLCGGWTRDNLKEDGGLGDLTRYMGFLKCYYTAGMIGGNAGYYAYPKGGFGVPFPADQPPHWLQQMTTLAHVHALFSHLEPFLREGDLLPGPNQHRLSKELAAYEFPTGDQDARVLARKLRAKQEWVVTAWAAAGPDREVKVHFPQLGDLTLRARGSGAVYRVRLANGKPATTLVDQDGLLPTNKLPGNPTVAVRPDDRLGEMITIPAGSFLMGNNGREGFEGPEEFPQHSVNLPAYQIGKYEVTRGQYRKFIEAGGYDDSQYWSAEGWKWKESDVIDYAGMHGQVTHTVRPNAKEKRNEPEHWAPEQEWKGHGFGHPRFIQTDNHPVVGVTYYEAEAYCKWAGGRLPTEAEWEKAARWDEKKQHANIWPWGDTWDPEKCNNPEDHNPAAGGYKVNQSAPVGSYPVGASPYGCMDMVGNAYEWVADQAKSYPGNPKPFDHAGYHFVRGGCWDDGPFSVRCAYRGWYLPPSSSGTGRGDSDYMGFRVARSGVNEE